VSQTTLGGAGVRIGDWALEAPLELLRIGSDLRGSPLTEQARGDPPLRRGVAHGASGMCARGGRVRRSALLLGPECLGRQPAAARFVTVPVSLMMLDGGRTRVCRASLGVNRAEP
jgi:hypothetical protein